VCVKGETCFSERAMVKSKEKTAEEIQSKLDLRQREITEKLRSLIKKTVTEAVEMVRRGRITYAVGGKDFGWISHSKNHVDLDFVCEARLSSALLKGRAKRKDVKHIEIRGMDRVDEEELTALLRDAAGLVC
jgi:hypothetical protein